MRLKREPAFSAAVNMASLSPAVYKLVALEEGMSALTVRRELGYASHVCVRSPLLLGFLLSALQLNHCRHVFSFI